MQLKFIAHAKHALKPAEKFKAGINKVDPEVNVQIHHKRKDAYDPNVDLYMIWGHRENKAHIMKGSHKNGKRYLVMERAYLLDRYNWISLGFDGLNGRADFLSDHAKMDRWNKHFEAHRKPWKTNSMEEGEYALLCGQVSNDQSIKHMNISVFYNRVIEKCNKEGIPVVFRPHPLENKKLNLTGKYKTVNSKTETLEQSLEAAKFTVTANSNAGVISVMEGVPVVVGDKGSMVYEIASKSINDPVYMPDDRLFRQWCRKMGYTQWLPEELESGEAWKHIKKGIKKKK